MNLKKVTRKFEKTASKYIYKKGMGVNTTISSKHAYGFYKRFNQENQELLKEAEEEMKRIKQKRRIEFLKRKKVIHSLIDTQNN